MKKRICTILAVAACLLAAASQNLSAQRTTVSFDNDWQFTLSESDFGQLTSTSREWRTLNLPHDWGVEGRYDKYNPSGRGGGYLPIGIGWYRKTFTVPASSKGKRTILEFDGIMACSQVFVNGKLVGERPNGYVPLAYDVTDCLKYGAENEIYVKADNSIQPASRWYTGCGIYRHVRLVTKEPVYMAQWSAYVKTGTITAKKAVFDVQAEAVNSTDAAVKVALQYILKDASGKEVAKSVSKAKVLEAGQSTELSLPLQYAKPHLWSVDDPYLYTVEVAVITDGKLTDNETFRIGMRSLRYDPANGFFLNDKNMKMYGVCIHSEAGALGSAVPLSVWRYRLVELKKLGANAIRLAHNPVAPEFLDLCDELGFLVMDETFDTWNAAKNHAEKAYNLFFTDWWEQDTRDVVMHDRNHPSVVIWSVGNEIRDNLNNEEGFAKYRNQQDLIHKYDGTRPVTMALFRPNDSKVYSNGFAEMMDVVGQNYRIPEFDAYHKVHPEKAMIGTEDSHDIETWLLMRDNAYVCGQFLWTGIDYLGESDWPMVKHGSGLIDITGKVKPSGLQRKSWWTEKPMVAMVAKAQEAAAPARQERNARPAAPRQNIDVTVYSNCQEVELIVDGNSLGKKAMPTDAKPVSFTVEGMPKAYQLNGFNDGKQAATYSERTPGKPARIVLNMDGGKIGTGFDDVAIIRASVVDENGIVCNTADHNIVFEVEGAELLATDSADLNSHEFYRSNVRQAYEGSCIAYIRANADPGSIRIKASAIGLPAPATMRLFK